MKLEPMLLAVRQSIALCATVQQTMLYQVDKYSADKQSSEPVTIADYGSQAIIGRALSQHFPQDAVIAEEAGDQFLQLVDDAGRAQIAGLLSEVLATAVTQDDVVRWLDQGKGQQSQRTWVIDPIDGTKGFVNMRHYAIAVGILDDGQPRNGIMGCPGYADGAAGGALFYTYDGRAYRQMLQAGEPQVIRVSDRDQPDAYRILQSFEREHASKERMANVRQIAGLDQSPLDELDSMEKYALVACGDADLYMRLPNPGSTRAHMSWDHAAGAAIVLAAGGRVTDVDGSPLDFSKGKALPNKGMIVSSGVHHDAVVQSASRVLAGE